MSVVSGIFYIFAARIMKTVLHILVIAFMACFVAACGGHADRASLVAIDSLILQDPDSACGMLAAYPADSLTTDDDRAYHALLTTIADYKAYRPATTDSAINIAVNHYDHDGANPDHRMRSLLYKGCVMEELGDPKAAMRNYKEAQYACPDNDSFHQGYIYYKIGCLFQSATEIEQASIYFKKAISSFNKIDEKFYSLNCLTSIGEIERITNPDTAIVYLYEGLRLAQKRNDNFHIFEAYSAISGYYSYYKQPDIALKYSLLAINNNNHTLGNNDVYYYACKSYVDLGKPDSAQLIVESMPEPQNTLDSIQLYYCYAEIYKAKGDTSEAYILTEKADKLLCDNNTSNNNGLVKISTTYDYELVYKSKRTFYTFIITFALCFIIILLFWQYRRKKITDTLKQNLSNLKFQLDKSLKELSIAQEGQFNSIKRVETLKGILSQHIELLKKSIPPGLSAKNPKICSVMDENFFQNLRSYINFEYPNLIDKLKENYNLKNEEINIICLELCRFPNAIQWTYSNCDRYKSLLNKKKIIANKVNGSESIADIPLNI